MGDLRTTMESLLQPSLPVALLGILIILGAPVLLHLILASSSTYTVPPTVLLLGAEAAGKTSLLTLFERGDDGPAPTHTTQTTQSVELNASVDSESRTSFRNHDDTSGTHTKFLMVDTPGHGKLRNVATGKLARTEKLRALVFVVDAAALGEQDVLAQTAAQAGRVPVLRAATTKDLFPALPTTLGKTNLEAELTRIRATRSKGLLDSGVGMDDVGSEEQDGWLGEYGSEKFSFKQMHEFDIDVEILPGNVTGDGPGADKWWWWIAQKI